MAFKQFWKKEKHIIVKGQTARFRIVKYIIILFAAYGFYRWRGLKAVGILLLSLVIIGTIVHFIFRWKTKGWTESWGPYKYIPYDEK